MELFFKEIHCKLIDNEHTFLLGLLLSFFIGDFFFLFLCKQAYNDNYSNANYKRG